MNKKQLKAISDRMLRTVIGKPCILCSEPANVAGMFFPNEPWEFVRNAPTPGTTRAIIYPVCNEHSSGEYSDLIEDALMVIGKGEIPLTRVREDGSIERIDG